mgnify:CR=1 FL=1|tara:strand:- start:10196 stop:10636 length:441 start_codon:yes stop_codon:yes gene_type:complete
MTEKKGDYTETVESLITFGDDGYTMRKDDPRTKEAIIKSQELKELKMKELISSGEASLFEGMNLSNKRAEGEEFKAYRDRLKTHKSLEKLYKTLGREECKRQFPMGFKYALEQAALAEVQQLKSQPLTATNELGDEIPVIIKNDNE